MSAFNWTRSLSIMQVQSLSPEAQLRPLHSIISTTTVKLVNSFSKCRIRPNPIWQAQQARLWRPRRFFLDRTCYSTLAIFQRIDGEQTLTISCIHNYASKT